MILQQEREILMGNSEYKRRRASNHNMLRLEKAAYWEDRARFTPKKTKEQRAAEKLLTDIAIVIGSI